MKSVSRIPMARVLSLSIAATMASGAAPQAKAQGKLEEIVVTARKRTENLQDVPVTVNVISKKMLDTLRVDGIETLAQQIPGLHSAQSTGSGGGNITLRGVGSAEQSSIIEQAVSIHIDGVAANDVRLMHSSLLDVEQIEVMRGPQALFYGKNSPGGVVSVRTTDPTDEFEASLGGYYETEAEETNGRIMISGPISEHVKARLFASYSEQEGLYTVKGVSAPFSRTAGVNTSVVARPANEDGFYGGDDLHLLGTLLIEPSDDFTIRLKYSFSDRFVEGSPFRNGQKTFCPRGTPQAFVPIDDCKLDDTIYQGALNPAMVALVDPRLIKGSKHLGDGYMTTKTHLGSLAMEYELGDTGLTIDSVTGYYQGNQYWIGDAAFDPATRLHSANNPRVRQVSEELRLTSNWEGRFNFTSGIYWEEKQNRNDVHTINLLESNALFDLGRDDFEQKAKTWSAFLALNFEISEQWSLSGGARYSDEKKSFDRRWMTNVANPATRTFREILLKDPSQSWDNLSPEVTLSFRPNDSTMLFVGYRTGFKSGGYDGAYDRALAGAPPAGGWDKLYNEEEVKGFEGGIKSTLLDDTLQLNVTAFSYKYTDMQLGVFDPVTTSLRILNAAKAKIKGVESEAVWVTAVDGLTLRANLNYLDAGYSEFQGPCYTGQTIDLGCNLRLNTAGTAFLEQDLSDEDLVFASKWTGALGFDYTTPITDAWNVEISGYAVYRGKYETATDAIPDTTQDSIWLTNLSASVMSANNTWEIYLKGTNLGNEFFLGRTVSNPLTPFGGAAVPRTGQIGPGVRADVAGVSTGGRRITLGFNYRM
jgi:iron complex outermembrane recepter protein